MFLQGKLIHKERSLINQWNYSKIMKTLLQYIQCKKEIFES